MKENIQNVSEREREREERLTINDYIGEISLAEAMETDQNKLKSILGN